MVAPGVLILDIVGDDFLSSKSLVSQALVRVLRLLPWLQMKMIDTLNTADVR